jgi:hypothetical protein
MAHFCGGMEGGVAYSIHRLSTKSVGAIKRPGRLADGGGLYLVLERARQTRSELELRSE